MNKQKKKVILKPLPEKAQLGKALRKGAEEVISKGAGKVLKGAEKTAAETLKGAEEVAVKGAKKTAKLVPKAEEKSGQMSMKFTEKERKQ